MKLTKAERQLIALEKGLRACRKLMTTMIREISPRSRHAAKIATVKAEMTRTDYATEDVVAVLKTFEIEKGDSGWNVRPPGLKMAGRLWSRVRKVMHDNGGDWSTQRQAFVFEEDPKPIFEALTQGKLVNQKKDSQAFYTPADVARKVMLHAKVTGHIVLEPSAGEGALAFAAKRHGAEDVICYEADTHAYDAIKGMFTAFNRDFLTVQVGNNYYRRIVMNPPFAKDAYIKHIKHALKFLRYGGKLVSIIPGKSPSAKLLQALQPIDGISWNVYSLPPNAFKDSGTNIQTSILVIDKDNT